MSVETEAQGALARQLFSGHTADLWHGGAYARTVIQQSYDPTYPTVALGSLSEPREH